MRSLTGCRTRSARFILNHDIVIDYENALLMSSLPLAIQLSTSLALILLPLVLIELALVVFSLVDLFRPERRVVGNNKLVWALIIVLIGTIGPIVYLLAGRKQT
jgi:Phospholipase_D-nuclease N-terminal